jgi:hypothetical protein
MIFEFGTSSRFASERGALLTPALPIGPSRLRLDAWREGMVLAWLWGALLVILVAIGLKLTSAALVSSVARALMPVFAGLIAWRFLLRSPAQKRAVRLRNDRNRVRNAGLLLFSGRRRSHYRRRSRRMAVVVMVGGRLPRRAGSRFRRHLDHPR